MTTTADATLRSGVIAAVQSLTDQYGPASVEVLPGGDGGAWVRVSGVDLGEVYTTHTVTVAFALAHSLPAADIYPLFISPVLARTDGQPLAQGFQQSAYRLPDGTRTPATQVSRRTRGQWQRQTAAQKVEKVLAWVMDQ